MKVDLHGDLEMAVRRSIVQVKHRKLNERLDVLVRGLYSGRLGRLTVRARMHVIERELEALSSEARCWGAVI